MNTPRRNARSRVRVSRKPALTSQALHRPVQTGFFRAPSNPNRRNQGPPPYVADTRYNRKVRVDHVFTGPAGVHFNVTFAVLKNLISLTNFTRCIVTRIEGWAVNAHVSLTIGFARSSLGIRTYRPDGSGGGIFDRDFTDVGVVGVASAHIPLVWHGSIEPFASDTAIIATLLDSRTDPSTTLEVVYDFHVSFYDTPVAIRTSALAPGALQQSRSPAPEFNEGKSDRASDTHEKEYNLLSAEAL